MAHEDAGNYSGKHPVDDAPDPRILEKVREYKEDNLISCKTAHLIAEELQVSPLEVGKNIDLAEIRINKCQNGLFGWPHRQKIVEHAEDPPEDMKNAVSKRAQDGKVSCRAVWEIAERFSISKIDAASVCEALSLKITPCQLGAF